VVPGGAVGAVTIGKRPTEVHEKLWLLGYSISLQEEVFVIWF
jgi:hypothetical protein